jgi:hypothetical protein
MNPRRTPHAPTRRSIAHLCLLPILLSTLLPFASRARAQTPQPTPPDEEVLSVRTDLILLRLFVTDAHNRRVAGLINSDF